MVADCSNFAIDTADCKVAMVVYGSPAPDTSLISAVPEDGRIHPTVNELPSLSVDPARGNVTLNAQMDGTKLRQATINFINTSEPENNVIELLQGKV
jgi:hypothetical protein